MKPRSKKPTYSEAEMAMLRGFVNRFIVPTKRERAESQLLGRTGAELIPVLQQLPEWVDPAAQHELRSGSSLQGPDVGGRLLDQEGLTAMLLSEAVDAQPAWGGLFITEDGTRALLIPEVGEVVLCSLPRRR